MTHIESFTIACEEADGLETLAREAMMKRETITLTVFGVEFDVRVDQIDSTREQSGGSYDHPLFNTRHTIFLKGVRSMRHYQSVGRGIRLNPDMGGHVPVLDLSGPPITERERNMLLRGDERKTDREGEPAWSEEERKAHATYVGTDRVAEILEGDE